MEPATSSCSFGLIRKHARPGERTLAAFLSPVIRILAKGSNFGKPAWFADRQFPLAMPFQTRRFRRLKPDAI